MKKIPWYVYIIETQKGLLYTGITNNVVRRFNEHSKAKKGKGGAKFFNVDPPKSVVYIEEVQSRSEATKKEILIKKMSRLQKIDLLGIYESRSKKIAKSIGLGISFKRSSFH